MKHPNQTKGRAASLRKLELQARRPLFNHGDVFAAVACSRCGAHLMKYEGHASAFQARLFPMLRYHASECARILTILPPTLPARPVGRPRKNPA